jgi:nucleoid-associated protein YgaU/transposase
MLKLLRACGIAAMLLIGAAGPATLAWASSVEQGARSGAQPVTIDLQVPPVAPGTVTTVTVQVIGGTTYVPARVQLATNASPSAPAVVAARSGNESVATVTVDAERPFAWSVLPAIRNPGCGPHPAPGTPGCSSTTNIGVSGAEPGPSAEAVQASPGALADDGVAQASPGALADDGVAQASPGALADDDVASTVSYAVQPGDTLERIARRFYGETSAVARIVEANAERAMPDGQFLRDPRFIRPGWVLVLPSPAIASEGTLKRDIWSDGARWYTVQPGDALASIAAGLLGDERRWPELFALNRDTLSQPGLVQPGMRLRLPDSASNVEDSIGLPDEPGPQPSGPTPEPTAAPAIASDGLAAPAIASDRPAAPAIAADRPAAPSTDVPVPGDGSVSRSSAARADDALVATAAPAERPRRPANAQLPDAPVLRSTMSIPLPAAAISTPVVSPATVQPPLPLMVAGAAVTLVVGLLRWATSQRGPRLFGAARHEQAPQPTARPAAPMGAREQQREQVLDAVIEGRLTQADAATVLDLSVRQLRRLVAAYRTQGPAGLVHANRGRSPWQAISPSIRTQVVALARERYVGLSQQQLTERLAREHGIVLHRTTVRRILLEANASDGTRGATAPVANEGTRGAAAPVASDDVADRRGDRSARARTPDRHSCLGQGRVPGCHCLQQAIG